MYRPNEYKKQEQVMDVQVAVLLFHGIKVRESLLFHLRSNQSNILGLYS